MSKPVSSSPTPHTTLVKLWERLNRARAGRRRVPVIMQMNAVECGAACLAMVLSYHGRATRLADCRESLTVGRDGVTAQTIAREARRFGLRVKGYSLQGAFSDFRFVPLPAIAHWSFNHFLVVERWSPQRVQVVDPARGRRTLTQAEWEEGFTGVVLTMEPGSQFERRAVPLRATWRSYLMHLLALPGTPSALLQIIGASLLLQGLGLLFPLITKILLDQILPFRLTSVMGVLGLGMALLVLSQSLLGYLRGALLLYLQARLDTQMMLGFFEHLLSLPFRFFQVRSTGDLLMRLASNATIRDTLTSQTIALVLDGLFVLLYLVILLFVDRGLGLLVLAIGGIQAALIRLTLPRVHELMQRDLSAQAESQGYLVEALTGIATVKAAGAEERTFERWSNLFFRQLTLSLERQHLALGLGTVIGAVQGAVPLLLLWVGVQGVMAGRFSVGTMLALNALALAFLAPLTSLILNLQRLQLVGAHLERLADVLEEEPEQWRPAVQPAPPLTGQLELRAVSFRYTSEAPLALQTISLTIPPGQKIALVGRTGSGKSTLAKLLLGLYPPTEGEIFYDGIPFATLDYRSVRQQCGVVLQESFLFDGSIRENIAFHQPTLSLDEVQRAAQQACIHDEIMQMPLGYETRIAEGGSSLAGGQRQRLSIARALAHRPTLLLLDEATSHLDVLTERQVDENLSALPCTRIVIAHRLSTIRNADLILVLEAGRVVEQGSHEKLLAQGGAYAALVGSQDDPTPLGFPGPTAAGR